MMLGQAIGPWISAAMMTYSLWLPLLAGPGMMAVGGLLIPWIPDTLGMRRYHEMHNRSSQSPGPEPFRRLPRQTSNFDPSVTPWSRVRDTVRACFRLVKIREIKLLLSCSAAVVPVVTISMNFFLRYMPLRFGWTFAATGMLIGVGTGLNATVLMCLVPSAAYIFSKARQERRDLIAARVSIILLIVGMAAIGTATDAPVAVAGLLVMNLGASAPALCRASLVRVAADRALPTGQIFGMVAVYETLGYIFCGIGLGALYPVCMYWAVYTEDTTWFAPFFYAAAFMLGGSGLSLAYLGTKKFLQREEPDSEDEDEVASAPRGSLSAEEDERQLVEARVLADGRILRKGPCLESVCLVA